MSEQADRPADRQAVAVAVAANRVVMRHVWGEWSGRGNHHDGLTD